jgi:hypothetical protein
MGFAVVDVNMRGTGCSGGAFRLLRAAAEPRRLRRDPDDRPSAVGARPQGRDDGHLLRRDQPAVHRPADPPALEAIAPLSVIDADRDDALPRRHPQHRLRRALVAGRQQNAEPATGPDAGSRGPTAIQAATRRARSNQEMHGEARTSARRSSPTPTTPSVADPTCSTRSRSCTRSRCRCSWPASSRTSRPAVTVPTC